MYNQKLEWEMGEKELQFENAPLKINNGTSLYLASSERLDGLQLTLSTIGGAKMRANGKVIRLNIGNMI